MRLRSITARYLVLGALLSFLSAATYAQDQQQPSLGDVARQARKDKEKNASTSKKVLTEDDLSTGKALSGLSVVGASPDSNDSSANPMARGFAALKRVEEVLDKLDPLDQATLAKAALLDHNVDFPDRPSWEKKLYAAKQEYVSHGREIIGQMRRILEDVQSLQQQAGGQKLNPGDPRAKELTHRMQELLQEAVRTDSAYQAVVMEGWDHAKQAGK